MSKRFVAFVLAVIMMTSLGFSVQASENNVSKQQQIQKELSTVTAQKKQASRELLNNKQVRNKIISELEQKGYEKGQIEAKIQEIEAAIKTLETTIQNAQEEYDAKLALFQKRLVVLYMRTRLGSDAIKLAECDDINQLFKRLHTMKVVSKADQDLMDEIVQQKQEIESLKAQKETEEDNAQDQLLLSLAEIDDLEVSRGQAEDRVSKSQQYLADLNDKEDELIQEDKELGELIRKVQSTGVYTGGTMQWPLPENTRIASYYGYRIHPVLKFKKLHTGLDITASKGTYIRAAASGKVIWSGWRNGGGGNTVIIDHGGGVSTLYLHIMKGGLLVKEGQIVSVGDVIAKVGSTGLATGPHLHFSVKVNGVTVDPLKHVSPN